MIFRNWMPYIALQHPDFVTAKKDPSWDTSRVTPGFAEKAKSPARESLSGAEHTSIARWEQQYFWTSAAQGKSAEAVWQSTMLVITLSAANAFSSQTHCTKDWRAAAASISQHISMMVTTACGHLHWEHLALVTAGREAPQLVASLKEMQSGWRFRCWALNLSLKAQWQLHPELLTLPFP